MAGGYTLSSDTVTDVMIEVDDETSVVSSGMAHVDVAEASLKSFYRTV